MLTDDFIYAVGVIVRISAGDITPAGTTSMSLPSSSQSATSTTILAPTPPDSNATHSLSLSKGAVAGIAVGASLAGILLIGTVALFLRRRRHLREPGPTAGVIEILGSQTKRHQGSLSPYNNERQQQHHPYELDVRQEHMQPYELNGTGG